jgi:hypothetical protein
VVGEELKQVCSLWTIEPIREAKTEREQSELCAKY